MVVISEGFFMNFAPKKSLAERFHHSTLLDRQQVHHTLNEDSIKHRHSTNDDGYKTRPYIKYVDWYKKCQDTRDPFVYDAIKILFTIFFRTHPLILNAVSEIRLQSYTDTISLYAQSQKNTSSYRSPQMEA